MKKSDFAFDIPQRQSQTALILIVYSRFKNLISRLWPFLLVAIFTGEFNFRNPDTLSIVIMVIAGLTGIIAIISYFRYYFWIEDNQLIIKKGILNKTLSQIPFERIQTIDFEQNLIHQFFNVVGLKIETAGSKDAETKMQALSIDKAKALREYILAQKLEAAPVLFGEEEDRPIVTEAKEIYRIKFSRLLKIGLTENHLRSGFIILFAIYWGAENISEAGYDLKSYGDQYYEEILSSITYLIVLGSLFGLVAISISVIRIFLKYFDLRFLRTYGGFKVISGLFNRKEVAAVDSKIQLIEWKQNLIQRQLGYHDLVLKQASSVEVNTKKSIVIPGVDQDDVNKVKDFLFPDRKEEETTYYQVNKWYLYRTMFYVGILITLLCSMMIYAQAWLSLGIFALIGVILIGSRIKKYRKAFYGVNDMAVFMRGGVFGHSKWLTMIHKIQSLEIKQTPFMVRRKLASLVVHTASGSRVIPFMELDKANYLYDFLTYRMEISDRDWM